MRSADKRALAPSMKHAFSILQTCVPPYRLPFFDLLAAELGPNFKVVAGDRFFDPSLRTVAGGRPWYSRCGNIFLFGDNAVWQTGKAVKDLAGSPLVVEGNPRSLRTWLILMSAKRRGVPAAVWGHARGRGSRRMSIIRRALFSLASHIICYCYNEREYLTRLFPNKTIIVAGNSSVHRKDCAPLTEPAESRNAVLFMGRLVASKKPMLLLQAVEILQKNGHDIGAVFIGEGPEKTFCERYAARAGLKGIHFAGQEFDVNKQRKLAQHCFALASPGYIGLSALDALGFGLPVAYCPTEPNSPEVETLVDDENALRFTRDSASALSSVLYDFYENRVAWLARGAEHCRTISEKYSIEHMAEEFTKFFRETAELAGKQSVEASLEERSNGFVFDPKSIDALSEALRRIADQKTKRLGDQETGGLTEMGRRSREIVAKFSCENFAQQALRAAEAASA